MVSFLALVFVVSNAFAGDRYANFSELARGEREGVDFRVRSQNRGAPLTVLAIHGGKIEIGTTELAEQIASSDYNFYTFEGLKAEKAGDTGTRPRRNLVLHLTSHHFDEPRALTLIQSRVPERMSELCLSVHGFFEDTTKHIACIGGGNSQYRNHVAAAIAENFSSEEIKIESPCRRFEGRDPQNVVNLCRNKGVQLELSLAVRRKLLADQGYKEKLVRALKIASERALVQ